MSHIHHVRLVPYSVQQMYQLVNDIAAYAHFVPGCVASRVLSCQGDQIIAALDLAKAGMRQSFTTQNTLTTDQRIEMQLVEGPFRCLNGGWDFIPIDERLCQVTLNLEFEFSSRWMDWLFSSLFKEVMQSMVTAFIQRAAVIYGE